MNVLIILHVKTDFVLIHVLTETHVLVLHTVRLLITNLCAHVLMDTLDPLQLVAHYVRNYFILIITKKLNLFVKKL